MATTLKAGDKVFIGRSGSWSCTYTEGTVVKVTPAGRVDAKYLTSDRVIRFGLNGQEAGEKYCGSFLDTKPFDERVALIAKERRQNDAARAIQDIQKQGDVKAGWGKESLQRIVTELEEKIALARKLVDAI